MRIIDIKTLEKVVITYIILLILIVVYLIIQDKSVITVVNAIEETKVEKIECDYIDIMWKDKVKKNISCDDLKIVIKHFGKDEKLIAIILEESAFDRTTISKNKNGSLDKGIYQLNNNYWQFKQGDLEYSSLQAKKCYQQNGYDCWTAHKNGAYKQHIENAKYILSKI